MSLRLSLIKAPEGIDLSRTNYIFSQSGGTLGRADSNTWALPDPDKFLSSCHCEITFADNQFFILDRSTNGTFINGSPEPIGRGSRSPLTDGDQIELGDYRFAVALEAQSSASFESNSPFGSNHSNQAENPLLRPSNDPFADFSTAKSEDFFSSPSNDPLAFFAAPDSAPFSTPGQASPFASDTKASAASSSPFAHTGDFLSDSRESDPFAKQALDDFLGDAEIASGAKNSSAVSFASVDLSPSLDQALEWPDSTQESVIPEDWADDLLAPSAPLRPKPATPAKAITPSTNGDNWAAASDLRPTQKPAPKTSGTESSSTEPSGLPQAKPHPASDNKTALEPRQPAPGLRERVPLSERLAVLEALQNQQLNAAPNEQPLESPPRSRQTQSTVNPAPAQVDPETGKARATEPKSSRVVEALGLDKSRLSQADIADIEQLSGELLREIVDGMLGVLRSRANIKNEFRMNVTTIQPIENNPLKFSVNVEDALENLFLKKSNAFKRPAQAFREGFQEIAEHQLAMIAGIRAGFDSMMDRFNPEPLESSFAKQGKGGLLPGMQKARYWNSYQEYYQGLSDNMDHSFQHLFGSEFVTAYEDQLRRLVASRPKDTHHE